MYPPRVLDGSGALALTLIGASYLLGQFPTAHLVAGDRARAGSGNPGASNVYRQAGRRAGALVFAGDALKGAVAVAAALLATGGDHTVAVLAGLAAVVGHCFPLFTPAGRRRFRGGKGVATSLGVVAPLHPLAAVAAAVTWMAVVALTHKASAASLAAIVAALVALALLDTTAAEVAGIAAVAAIVVVRHTDNIVRLVRGEERSLR